MFIPSVSGIQRQAGSAGSLLRVPQSRCPAGRVLIRGLTGEGTASKFPQIVGTIHFCGTVLCFLKVLYLSIGHPLITETN